MRLARAQMEIIASPDYPGRLRPPFLLLIMNYTIDREKAIEFKDLLDDTLQYYCDENMISGELALVMAQAYVEGRLAQFRGEV